MKRITVDLEDALYERLRKAAFDQHEPVSAATREALEDWLNRREANEQ
jgi:predicted transcriptional regulator